MKRKILNVFWFLTGLGFLGAVLAIMLIAFFSFGLPKISTLADYRPSIPSTIYAKDGTVLAVVGKEKRQIASLDEVPQRIIDAFLSAEDSGFYEHTGVDYLGIARAMIVNLKAGRVVQGGSTITQQVAKSLLLSSERSIVRKIKDVLLARKIEKQFSKQEILYLYLNQVYLGGGYYGVKQAFDGYFGKTLDEATVAESAMIAGLLVAPGRYSPYIHPDYAKKRQEYVLGRMYANNKITEEEYQTAMKEQIKYQVRLFRDFKAGYFTDWVRQRVIALVGEDKFLNDGFKVYTTLDWELQQIAEEEVKKGSRAIDRRQGYKGPLKNFESAEEIDQFLMDYRKELMLDASNYFVVNDEFKKVYEFNFTPEEYTAIRDQRAEWNKEFAGRNFLAGIAPEDQLVDILKEGTLYKAIVEKVDYSARLIYVNVAGVPGIINYYGYNWAHPRQILEERNYFSLVINPNEIVKVGDQILVSIKDKNVRLLSYAYKNFRSKVENAKHFKEASKQRYMLCELEQDPEVQSTLFSISPQSGEVIAYVGGNDFSKTQFNRIVQSLRQPGSSFKPIIYAAALENGFTPATMINDSPEALGGADETLNWKPRNYDGNFMGPMTFRRALEVSRNIPAIKVAEQVTVPVIHDFAKRICFNAKIDPDLSLSLGSFGVTLKDLVAAYSIFPNGGKIVDVKSITDIEDRDGTHYSIDEAEKMNEIRKRESEIQVDETMVIAESEPTAEGEKAEVEKEKVNEFYEHLGAEQVYDERLAYVMTNLLRGVVVNGTGKGVKEVSQFLGAKTGTTNSYFDAWFVGFSSNVATGVWTGFDENKTMGWGLTGSNAALPIWKNYMKAVINKYGETDFKIPNGIIHVKIDGATGKLAKGASGYIEAFVEGTEPKDENTFEQSIPTEEPEKESEFFEEEEFFL